MSQTLEEILTRITNGAERNRAKNRENALAWRNANTEKARVNSREWYASNPDKRAVYRPKKAASGAKRRALKLNAVPDVRDDLKPIMQAETLAIYAEARTTTELTGIRHDVDHIFPLSKGGVHAPWNLRVLLGAENQSKKDKWPKGEPTHVMWHGELMSRLIG